MQTTQMSKCQKKTQHHTKRREGLGCEGSSKPQLPAQRSGITCPAKVPRFHAIKRTPNYASVWEGAGREEHRYGERDEENFSRILQAQRTHAQMHHPLPKTERAYKETEREIGSSSPSSHIHRLFTPVAGNNV